MFWLRKMCMGSTPSHWLADASPEKTLKAKPAANLPHDTLPKELKAKPAAKLSRDTLPDGWTEKIIVRKTGDSKGKKDFYWVAPDKVTICRSMPDIERYLDEHWE